MHARVEVAYESLSQLAGVSLESARNSIDLIDRFVKDLGGVQSFKVIPKSNLAVEVDIQCKDEQELIVKQTIAPFIELYSLQFGRKINFEALINKTEKGLQLDINDGFNINVSAPLVGIQRIAIKGSSMLMQNKNGQLALSITTKVPGLDNPVSIAIPLKSLLSGVQNEIKNKMTGR